MVYNYYFKFQIFLTQQINVLLLRLGCTSYAGGGGALTNFAFELRLKKFLSHWGAGAPTAPLCYAYRGDYHSWDTPLLLNTHTLYSRQQLAKLTYAARQWRY